MADSATARDDEAVDEAASHFGLGDADIREVVEAIDQKRFDQVAEKAASLHGADLADLIEQVGGERRALLVKTLRSPIDPDLLSHLDGDIRETVMGLLRPADLAAALSEMESDDALELIEDLDDEQQAAILEKLPAPDRAIVEQGLAYPEDSAGRLMQREFVMVPMYWTVGETIDHLRATKDLPDDFFDIFVVDPRLKLVGIAPLSRLMRNRRPTKVADLMTEEVRRIPAEMDREDVAYIFRQYGLVDAPVVDDDGRLLGVVTVDDVVHVLGEETEEDMLKLAGVQESDLFNAALKTARTRFTWLFINLITAILASAVIALFEATIQQIVALAVLMPIVASMGGNAGTQTLTVAVRALATKDLSSANAARVIGKELLVGLLNGIVFAVLTGVAAYLWLSSWEIGTIIACAMVFNLVVAAFFGAFIPIILERVGVDPAVASSVLLTTVTDIVGFLAFLGLAAVFLL